MYFGSNASEPKRLERTSLTRHGEDYFFADFSARLFSSADRRRFELRRRNVETGRVRRLSEADEASRNRRDRRQSRRTVVSRRLDDVSDRFLDILVQGPDKIPLETPVGRLANENRNRP